MSSNLILCRIISLLIGYAFGNISISVFLSKRQNVDLQHEGSGNVGSTNTMRVMGIKAGAMTLACDCLKCILATFVVFLIFRNTAGDNMLLLRAYAAMGAILGHDFPIALHFKGGKGVACTVGMLIAIYPQLFFWLAAFFLIIVFATRYVSLGSCLSACLYAFLLYWFYRKGLLIIPSDIFKELFIIAIIQVVLILFLHRGNIKRLLSGTENKFSLKKKENS